MKTNIGQIALFTLVLGAMALGGDTTPRATPAAAHASVSAVRTEKCPDCGQAIKLRMVGSDTWELSCPKCGEPMRTVPTGYNTLSAKCPAGDPEIQLTRGQRHTVSFDCPGCNRQMVLKCPDCGDGVLKYQKVTGDPVGAKCVSCHKDVAVK
jgi:predicted RNA-binding Zn-ribbon protein involved in translation (DUF1610 family)